MRYYLIAGEASGDLHASHLIRSIAREDPEAEFRFFGGDLMAEAAGTTPVRHYRELAYMGFVPVLLHLRTIFRNMARAEADIVAWQPQVVILVDYPGFNLRIARYLRAHTAIPAYYYISPKIWAWKEWRIRAIRRDVSEMFSILPFEVPFYERHSYPIHYVGNPTAHEVRSFRAGYGEDFAAFASRHHLDATRGVIALLPGSRLQEIRDNLPLMLRAAREVVAEDAQRGRYQIALACAPCVDTAYYRQIVGDAGDVTLVGDDTYPLLAHSAAALVTSGTATLETALMGVPQVVCYKTPLPHLIRFAFRHIIRVRYISLVNLIADREVVAELMADRFTLELLTAHLRSIMPGGSEREAMLRGYAEVERLLGSDVAPERAAGIICGLLRGNHFISRPQ